MISDFLWHLPPSYRPISSIWPPSPLQTGDVVYGWPLCRISTQKKGFDWNGLQSHWSSWLLVHKKPGPQEIWFQNENHFTAFNAGTKFWGTKFLGDQISQGQKQPRTLRSKWDRGPFQLLLQKEFHPNANLVQQPGESQQFKVAFTAGNCGWLWSKPLMRKVRTSRRHLLAEKELSMVHGTVRPCY